MQGVEEGGRELESLRAGDPADRCAAEGTGQKKGSGRTASERPTEQVGEPPRDLTQTGVDRPREQGTQLLNEWRGVAKEEDGFQMVPPREGRGTMARRSTAGQGEGQGAHPASTTTPKDSRDRQSQEKPQLEGSACCKGRVQRRGRPLGVGQGWWRLCLLKTRQTRFQKPGEWGEELINLLSQLLLRISIQNPENRPKFIFRDPLIYLLLFDEKMSMR